LNTREKVQSFLAGGSVARVIEIHEDGVEFAGFDGGKRFGRRRGAVNLVAFAAKQKAESVADVGLIVGDEDSMGM